ncbi:hypothetical protein F5883DRAFT_504267 [Diaporthe sp. PMI_573]|nr:hypothetical protein F5883DRAFT_504267 [Diaporthaceae sp. PMI_573]
MAILYSVLTVALSDAEAIARGVDVSPMLNGPLFRTTFPTYSTMSPEEREEMAQWYIDGMEQPLWEPGDEVYLKVCQHDGGHSAQNLMPVGFCAWEVIDQELKQQEEQQEQNEGKPPNTNDMAKKHGGNKLLETLDVDAWIALSSKLRRERMRILKGRDNICRLTFMAIHPDFQRRGIGSMLLQRVCDETDKVTGRCTYILAAPEGVLLYSRFGFEVVGKVETPHGNITSMLRPPRQ